MLCALCKHCLITHSRDSLTNFVRVDELCISKDGRLNTKVLLNCRRMLLYLAYKLLGGDK